MFLVKCISKSVAASSAEKSPSASSPVRSQFSFTYPTASDVIEPRNRLIFDQSFSTRHMPSTTHHFIRKDTSVRYLHDNNWLEAVLVGHRFSPKHFARCFLLIPFHSYAKGWVGECGQFWLYSQRPSTLSPSSSRGPMIPRNRGGVEVGSFGGCCRGEGRKDLLRKWRKWSLPNTIGITFFSFCAQNRMLDLSHYVQESS